MSRTSEPMLPSAFVVTKRWDETKDVFTFELRPESKGQIPDFLPGQFNMIYAWGIGEVPISVSGDPANRRRLIHTIRRVGAATSALGKLKARDVVGVRGPFGSHWPVEKAGGKDVIVAAGGLGLAPLRPAVYRLLSEPERFGKLILLYGARLPSDLLFAEEIESWKASGKIDVQVAVDAGTPDWRGNVGHVTTLLKRVSFRPQDSIVFLCGPEVMMRFMAMDLLKRGISSNAIYLSMERNMKCAVKLCGHCQYREHFVCADGPVYSYARLETLLRQREL